MKEKTIQPLYSAVVIMVAVMFVLLITGCMQEGSRISVFGSKGDKNALCKEERMEWWRDARFGMFIHWGLYAVPAGEWKGEKVPGIGEWIMQRAKIPVAEYEKLAGQFNPVKFDAEQWVQIAKNAGMKYIVITSKHHDGFCLWDSKYTDYDVVDATPFKRDILGELSEACRKNGIRLCFYHSIMDWHHPDAQAPFYPNYNDTSKSNPNFDRYVEYYLKGQLKELVQNYGPLGIMWFDGEWVRDWTREMGWDMFDYCLSLLIIVPESFTDVSFHVFSSCSRKSKKLRMR